MGFTVDWRVIKSLFVRADIDAFIGLFNNNLSTLLVVISSLTVVLGTDIVYNRIVPGLGISMLAGNFYYFYMAYKLCIEEDRTNVTAQPYGINTPGAFVFVFAIIYPICYDTSSSKTFDEKAELAWKVGVLGNLITGIILVIGSFVGAIIQKITPTIALLSALCGISFSFLFLNEIIDIIGEPHVGLLPMVILFVGLFGGVKYGPLPAAFLAMTVGTILGWIWQLTDVHKVSESGKFIKFYAPVFPIGDVLAEIHEIGPYINIIIPVAFTVVVGTIQCVESARLAGDKYSIRESMLTDGCGTIVGSLFGSILGMTIYIGHPAFKRLGARGGYSILNGILFTIICFTGLSAPLLAIIIIQSVEPIIIFIGIIIITDTLTVCPTRLYPAVLVGIVPMVAQWGTSTVAAGVSTTYDSQYSIYLNKQSNLYNISIPILNFDKDIAPNITEFNYNGMNYFGLGGLLEGVLLATITIKIIDRKFKLAAFWSFSGIILSLFGIINSDKVGFLVNRNHDEGWKFSIGYSMITVLFGLLYLAQSYKKIEQEKSEVQLLEEPMNNRASLHEELQEPLIQ